MYKSESKIRKEGNHIYHPKEIKYSETPIWKFSMPRSTGAGFIIGAAGAGGGMLLVPIVVEMGLNGRSATALSGFMYVFVSGAAVVITLLANKITY
jgi:uncharacterized membrane protein YfcA